MMDRPTLKNFNQADLTEYIFPGTDAAIVFVAENEKVRPEIAAILKLSYQQRWFPVPEGHSIKIPYHFSKGYENLFTREIKGWNHEHCDFCEKSIGIGERAWTAPRKNGIYLFCEKCRETLRGRPGWAFWR